MRAAFRLVAESGPTATLALIPTDPSSYRWCARALTTAYERHEWRWSTATGNLRSDVECWDARRSRPLPEPFRTPNDGVATFDAVVLTFAALPPGARLEWAFRPLRLSHPAYWEVARPSAELPPRRTLPGAAGTPSRPTNLEEGREYPIVWEARVRLAVKSRVGDPTFGRSVARAIESATRGARGNGLRLTPRRWWANLSGNGFPLTEPELVLTLPSPSCPVPSGSTPRLGRRPAILPLGRTSAGRVIGPSLEPAQGRHLAILGETGMGKSSLLVAICRRVTDASGLIFFDPLGDTAHAIRDELPPKLASRTTWVDPHAASGLNALEGIGPGSPPAAAGRERRLNDLVHSLRRVRSGRYADSGYWGPRLEEMLTRALAAAAAIPGGTLEDAHRLLAAGGRGYRTVSPEAAEAVRELSDRIRSRPEDAEGARRLLYEVTRSPILVRMLCEREPSSFARELVAPHRIVLIAGDAAAVGESTARYLLSVYLALVWAELLARPGIPKTFVVLDEAQWFVHESLAEMLRLGRRRNVHVVLATQAIASLPELVAEAVWTNVADFVTFRGSPDEARDFSRMARGVPSESILSLPRGEAAVLLGKGNSVDWIHSARIPGVRPEETELIGRPRLSESRGAGDATAEREEEPEPPPVGDDEPPVDTQSVLRAIAQRADRARPASLVRISLVALRREVDPSGRAVRAAGTILGRSGAIVRTGRDESGPYWWVDPQRLPVVEPRDLGRDDETRSDRAQPS
ncbi:MAG: DUF87 domain-containing protein [Thermoplasmata archaeon]